MTFRSRILLDRWLAIPASIVCNIVARVLGRVLRRDHSLDSARSREIVVCKLVGLGSVLQSTPLVRALKQRFPEARLTYLTLESNRALVARLENVDEVLCLDDSGAVRMAWTTLRALAALTRRRVDHYFDLEVYSGFACMLSLFSLARNRLGFYRHSSRYKRGIYTHLVYFNTRMPVRKIYLQLGRVAGADIGEDDSLSGIRIEREERGRLHEKLSALGLKQGDPYVLVNPNASDLLIERRWPMAYMAEAVGRLARLGNNIVLMGSPAEARFVSELCEQIAEPVRERIFNTAGRLSLVEAFTLIEGAACVLTNDTGPMHMALALRRPTVCLFGPVDPEHYGMEGPGIVTLYAPVPCSPCVHEIDEAPCQGKNFCMQRLLPDLVVTRVVALLKWAADPARPADTLQTEGSVRLPLVWEDEAGMPLGIVVRDSLDAHGH